MSLDGTFNYSIEGNNNGSESTLGGGIYEIQDNDLTNLMQNESSYYEYEQDFSHIYPLVSVLNMYITPVIIIVGLIGNFISFMIYGVGIQRHQSSSVYLASIAVSDSVLLMTVFGTWVEHFNVNAYNRSVLCQMNIYLSYTCGFLSVWFLVCFSTERYIAVFFPFKRHIMCTERRAKAVVITVTLIGLLTYCSTLWTTGLIYFQERWQCAQLEGTHHYHSALTYIDIAITFFIPFLLILVLNCSIIYKIALFYRHQGGNAASATNSATGLILRRCSGRSGEEHNVQMKVTVVLVVISIAFLVLNLPSYSLRALVLLSPRIHTDMSLAADGIVLLQQVCQELYYTSFAINFFLYISCSKQFRLSFVKYVKMFRHSFVACCKKCRISSRKRLRTESTTSSLPAARKTQTINLTNLK
ncbi:unnamed protein product [Owenia fusiformis]|uniref:Uncharacterized protein n=1 Tax=Owenia fusiformis TaxID=6347 RepID=A0A8J1TT52_OWEFU|nr:unnamed protein product [Owenia fusiformis]